MSKMRYGTPSGYSGGEVTPESIGAFDLESGTALIAGQNLDAFTTPGSFYCANGTTAAALSNTPITANGFKLIVMKVTSVRLVQIVFNAAANTRIYTRFWNTSTWGSWHLISSS